MNPYVVSSFPKDTNGRGALNLPPEMEEVIDRLGVYLIGFLNLFQWLAGGSRFEVGSIESHDFFLSDRVCGEEDEKGGKREHQGCGALIRRRMV